MPRSTALSLLCAALASGSALWALADSYPRVTYLDQGWSNETRQLFYFTPQGSRMIPYSWFVALERADGQDLFSATGNLEKYGFLAADASHELNPDQLPIGFAIDPVEIPDRGRAVGLTCAACHTANVSVAGKVLRIDGAPARLDFDHFYADLAAAFARTVFDPDSFQRFAKRVLPTPDPATVNQLHQEVADFQATLAGDVAIRRPSLASGFGRVDALTQIVNSLAVVDQADPRNLRTVSAPVRFPQLWLTPELEFVQWNPVAASPIGRNSGEVLGVFGSAKLSGAPETWYDSTILISNLHRLETWIEELKPPHWDEAIFGRIDRNLAAEGEALYRQHCSSCHNAPPFVRTDPATNLFGRTFVAIGRVNYRTVGTDPTYVEALAERLVHTNAATAPPFGGRTVVPAPSYFLQTVGPIVERAMDRLNLTDDEKVAMNGFRLRPPRTPGGPPEPYLPPSVTDLKAGPLAGAWASGPYLHNGSVPTIDELLSPVSQRRRVFWTGGHELDLKRLGYASDDAPGRFRFETETPGNRNTGHVYPIDGLTSRERAAIIEFIKTL